MWLAYEVESVLDGALEGFEEKNECNPEEYKARLYPITFDSRRIYKYRYVSFFPLIY